MKTCALTRTLLRTLRVWALGLGVWDLGFEVSGFGFRGIRDILLYNPLLTNPFNTLLAASAH